MYDTTNQLIRRLTRNSAALPRWYSASVLALVHCLVTFLVILSLDGIAVVREYLIYGFIIYGLAHAGLLHFTALYGSLHTILRDSIVDAIMSLDESYNYIHYNHRCVVAVPTSMNAA